MGPLSISFRFPRPATLPPGRPLLDMLSTSPLAAYGLRRLRADYAGPVIRVRRSSDNVEQDIGVAGVGLDAAALLAFAGAGNGHVVTWHDQSGAGRHLVQTTAAAQPLIVSAGSYLGDILFNSANLHRMAVYNSAFNLHASPATICAALGSVSNQNNTFLNLIFGFGNAAGSRLWLGSQPGTRDIAMRPNGVNHLAAPVLTMGEAGSIVSMTKTAAANMSGVRARLNGSAPSTFPAEGFGAFDGGFILNNTTNFGISSTTRMREILIFPAEMPEDQLSIIARNQGAFWGVAVI